MMPLLKVMFAELLHILLNSGFKSIQAYCLKFQCAVICMTYEVNSVMGLIAKFCMCATISQLNLKVCIEAVGIEYDDA